jgi:hypothetical protein
MNAEQFTLRQQMAVFYWNSAIRRFEVEVCGYIVASFRKIREVEAFSMMHHDGFGIG